MYKNIDNLIRLNVELEGLLHVLSHRDSLNVRTLLKSKFNMYSECFQALLKELENEAAGILENQVHDLSQSVVKEEEAVTSESMDEMEASVAAVDREENVFYNDAPAAIEEKHDVDIEFFDDNSLEDEESAAKRFEQENMEDANVLKDEDSDDEDPQKTPTASQALQSRFARYAAASPHFANNTELSVDEMLSRKGAVDLKRVFTLNDKFRFRRALFNQDDNKFAETLGQLAEFESFEEARNFVVDEFGWDVQNPDVEDFLSIIKPHYLK